MGDRKKVKVNIAASNRFHLLDLARELHDLGYDVRFYSYVPPKRCFAFGLPIECCQVLFIAFPFLLLQRIFPAKTTTWIWYRNIAMDWYMAHFMRPCDIYIPLGTVYLKSIQAAQKKFHAKVILEWGSKHIIEQQICLNKTVNTNNRVLKRELESYEVTNYISIPASHVKESFIRHGFSSSKLWVNPYGVDLSHFPPTKLVSPYYDLIFVGGWRYEKGCDLIIDLCKKYKYSFLHVGNIVNIEFPSVSNMFHQDSVNQNTLFQYYSQAKVFILPSRAEGLALVQAQALACGLPVVCSKDSGGLDLKRLISHKEWVIEMQDYDLESLHKCVEKALSLANTQHGIRKQAIDSYSDLTWKSYGRRYDLNLKKLTPHL